MFRYYVTFTGNRQEIYYLEDFIDFRCLINESWWKIEYNGKMVFINLANVTAIDVSEWTSKKFEEDD